MILHFKTVEIGNCTITGKRAEILEFKGGECQHKNLTAAETGEVLTCRDCHLQVSPFWALMRFAGQVSDWRTSMEARAVEITRAESKQVTLRAAQRVEKAWRSRKMAPLCPHCRHTILPTDGFGNSTVSKLYAVRPK